MPPGRLSGLRRVFLFLPRFRTILLSFFGLGAIACSIYVWLHVSEAVLIRRAYLLEKSYLYAMGTADLTDLMSNHYLSPPVDVYQRRIQGLIQDAPQLHYWSVPDSLEYDEWLSLHFDGTGWGEAKGREYWIYFGGTPENTSEPMQDEDDPTVFKHRYRTHSCKDPPHVCNSYNSAFNRISERWHGLNRSGPGHSGTSKALLRYVDCDISPLQCGQSWGFPINPVMLAHMKIGYKCDCYLGQVQRCPVSWRFFRLPMRNLPWTRQVRIPLNKGGFTVVPAFPDAEEQMWTLMSLEGAEEGLPSLYLISDVGDFDSNLLTVFPVPDEPPQYSAYLGVESWALLQTYLRYPLGWPREVLIRCYLERWLDQFLRWWDGPPYAAVPQSCSGIEERHEKNKRLMEGAENLVINHGVNPDQIFFD